MPGVLFLVDFFKRVFFLSIFKNTHIIFLLLKVLTWRKVVNRNLALEFVRVTEMAAIASARFMGRGDANAADEAAIEAMRATLDSVECNATVIIGEGSEYESLCKKLS